MGITDTEKIYEGLGISREVWEYGQRTESRLKERFEEFDKNAEYNQMKVIRAMQENRVSEGCFNYVSGYGYNDLGRDTLESVYASVFHTEAALVRPQITCGTHALALALAANLRPGDELLSPVGKPYDTLEEVIGIRPSKGSLAEYGITYRQVDFLFEAAVAGGIPIIRPLKQCLAANDISEIVGIVNGTTNYILTKMTEEGMDFADALKKAQELGFAEADPTADVEGLDAGRKVAIMASIAFHSRVVFFNVHTEGITKITARDIAYAKEFDSVIKLLGVAHNTENGIEVGVYPMMIRKEHPLASVRDSFNAVFVHGDAVDDAMFYGRGAGEFPTASAVMGDVIDVVRNIGYGCTGRISCTCYKDLPIKEFGQVKNKFFIRMQVANEPGVLAAIAEVFGDHKVSITRVVQEHSAPEAAELVIVTERVKECNMQEALKALMEIPSIQEISSIIREY